MLVTHGAGKVFPLVFLHSSPSEEGTLDAMFRNFV